MPRYLYACRQCGSEFEVEKTMSAAARGEACPQCGNPGNRVFTAPALAGQTAGFSEGEPSGGCSGCCPGGTCGLE